MIRMEAPGMKKDADERGQTDEKGVDFRPPHHDDDLIKGVSSRIVQKTVYVFSGINR